MRISDWSSDVCSSDLRPGLRSTGIASYLFINNSIGIGIGVVLLGFLSDLLTPMFGNDALKYSILASVGLYLPSAALFWLCARRSEEHTSELQSLMRISYAVFCLKKQKPDNHCYLVNNRLPNHCNNHDTHTKEDNKS